MAIEKVLVKKTLKAGDLVWEAGEYPKRGETLHPALIEEVHSGSGLVVDITMGGGTVDSSPAKDAGLVRPFDSSAKPVGSTKDMLVIQEMIRNDVSAGLARAKEVFLDFISKTDATIDGLKKTFVEFEERLRGLEDNVSEIEKVKTELVLLKEKTAAPSTTSKETRPQRGARKTVVKRG